MTNAQINAEAVRLMARAGRAAPNNSGAMKQAKEFFDANFAAMEADTRISARWIGIWTPKADRVEFGGAYVVACDEGLFVNGRRVAK